MAINNQDKTEIHNLPEVTTLQPGMMVAVDSEPTGSKSFNLTTALEGKANADDISALEIELAEKADASEVTELATSVASKADASDMTTALDGKVDAPATTPAEGQVLTFNGSANTWANPPEGGYVLNYTEIGSFTDIDVERMKTQPTFVRIDAEQSITIKTSLTNTITIPLEIGTMMRLVEQSTAWAVFVAEKVKYYPTGTDNASFGANACHVNILLRICKPDVSSTTKVFSCYGDIEDTSALFNESPMPCTMHYQNARGADLDTGNVFTQYTGRATAVQFNSASGKYRRNLLMPEEIQSHDFSSDTTPEQIQFMGWGATSNRAGYKNLITAQHNYDSTDFPQQTPQVQFSKAKMSGGTPGSDQVLDIVQASMKSSDGQSTTTIGGILVPSISGAGVLQNWSDSNGGHYGWKPVNEVPASTSVDAGKVLSVDSNGTPCWGNAVGFVKNAGALTDAATITASNLNNGFATLSTSQSALTIIDEVGTDEIVNFAIEITPSVNCTLTIKKKVGSGEAVTMKHAVAAGNTLEANKTYQVTAVGSCWTLAEFTA